MWAIRLSSNFPHFVDGVIIIIIIVICEEGTHVFYFELMNFLVEEVYMEKMDLQIS